MPRPDQVLPDREREICDRVRFFRKQILKWSQPALAKEMGITQNQLGGIEYKRARLQFGAAKFLCDRFDINLRWLALGELPIRPRLDVLMEFSGTVKYSSHFSWVFDRFLDHLSGVHREALIKTAGVDAYEKGEFEQPIFLDPSRDTFTEGMASYVMNLIARRLRSLPEKLRLEYAAELLWAEESFRTKHKDNIPLSLPIGRDDLGCPIIIPKQIGETPLTDVTEKRKRETVKSEIQKLTDRLKKQLSQHGAKKALADKLGVAPARISEWLSGKPEPGGEIALKMLHWVEQKERQK